MLLLFIGWYCWAKKLLKMLNFSLKLEIRLLLTNNGGITGVFLPLMKVFIMDQYLLLEVLGSFFFHEVVVKVFFWRFNYVYQFCTYLWRPDTIHEQPNFNHNKWCFLSISFLIMFLNPGWSWSLQIIFLFEIKLWKILNRILLNRYNCSLTFLVSNTFSQLKISGAWLSNWVLLFL